MWRLSCLGNTTLSLTGCLVVGDVPLNRERVVALAALVPKSLVQGVAKTSKKRGSMKGSTVCEPVLPSIQRKAPTSLAPQHWSMLGAVRGESDGTKKFVVSTIQEQNLYSLTKVALPQRAMNSYLELVLEQAAKRRQNRLKQSLVLSPEHGTDGASSNGAFPLVPSRASSPEMGRFMNFDSSLFRWLLEEDLAVSDLNAEISDNRRRLLEVSVIFVPMGIVLLEHLCRTSSRKIQWPFPRTLPLSAKWHTVPHQKKPGRNWIAWLNSHTIRKTSACSSPLSTISELNGLSLWPRHCPKKHRIYHPAFLCESGCFRAIFPRWKRRRERKTRVHGMLRRLYLFSERERTILVAFTIQRRHCQSSSRWTGNVLPQNPDFIVLLDEKMPVMIHRRTLQEPYVRMACRCAHKRSGLASRAQRDQRGVAQKA